MTEEAENPDVPSPEDLESLFGDLDLTPDWAKGNPGVTQSQPVSRGREGRREGGRPRAPKSSRPNMQGVRVKPRRNDPSSERGNSRDSQGGGRRDNFHERPRYQERAPRVPVHVDFIPEKKRLSKVVKVIRQSHRAFPLKVVAGKFMENPRFISMKYTVKDQGEGAEEFYLYVCTANGMVFSDVQSCEQYVLGHGMDATYEREDREVPPPTGNFVCVGRHSRSGKLVGPPNWHGYQARLEALRKDLAEGMPTDAFSRQIEMVHEEEVIEAWKKEVSVKSFYRKKIEKPEAEAPKAEPVAQDTETDPEADASKAEAGAQEAGTDPADPPEATNQPEATDQPEAVSEEPPVDDRPYEWTYEQAEADFREHHLPKLVRKTKRAIMPGYLFAKMTDPGLQSLTEFHLKREHDRPNSIIFALRPAFKHMRLHVFRLHGDMLVSGVSQHPLPDDLKVVDEIRSLLNFVTEHPGCTNQEALKAVANKGDEIPAELVSHFRWLVEKGHLIEMHDDTLQVPHTPRSKK